MAGMYKLRPPVPMNVHRVFVSSSDEEETQRLRSRIKGLIDDVINPMLLTYPEAEVLLSLQTWERSAPQRVDADEHVNQIFIEQVRQSALTIGLLLDEVRPFTEEELVEGLDDSQVQVAIHVFDRTSEPPEHPARDVDDFLQEHRAKIFYDNRCGPADGDAAWFALVRTLLRFTFAAMRDNDPRTRLQEVEVR
jgi:phenylalanyl-tRNA synthetase alpha subunit